MNICFQINLQIFLRSKADVELYGDYRMSVMLPFVAGAADESGDPIGARFRPSSESSESPCSSQPEL